MQKTDLKKFLASISLGLVSLLLASCTIQSETPQALEPEETQVSSPAPEPEPTETEPAEAEPTEAELTEDSETGNYITIEQFQAAGDAYQDSKVVLFFNAGWCSTCKKARDNFEADFGKIPADLLIVIVNFDDSDELRKKHEVIVQHTFVELDAQGETLKKWYGSVSVDEVLAKLS